MEIEDTSHCWMELAGVTGIDEEEDEEECWCWNPWFGLGYLVEFVVQLFVVSVECDWQGHDEVDLWLLSQACRC